MRNAKCSAKFEGTEETLSVETHKQPLQIELIFKTTQTRFDR